MNDDEVAQFSELVGRRVDFLAYLRDGPAAKRDMVDALPHSRSTVDRAIEDLVADGLVRRSGGEFETTATGALALDEHRRHAERMTDLRAAREALAPLPGDAALSPAVVADATVTLVDGPLPYAALEPVRSALQGATRVRALLPNVVDARFVRRYRERATAGASVRLVLDPTLRTTLAEQFPGACRAMAGGPDFEALEGSVPPFGLLVTESDGERAVSLVVYTDAGSVHAVIHTSDEDAVAWAEDRYAEAAAAASSVTASFAAIDADAADAPPASPPPAASGADDTTPSLALESEGVLELSGAYFDRRAASDPVDAWRTGLGLPEVAAGYAVDRTRPADGDGDDADDGDRTNLTERLLEGLRGGVDHAVLGAPGAGKSTVCKTVAHEWYDRDLGPVLYRESGRGDAFESPAELRSTVEALSGRVLVVVEDAVRAEAAAALRLAADLAGTDEVTFLFDARESEWRDPDELPVDARLEAYRETVDTVPVPALDEREVARFVERFESITGLRVPVEPAELLSAVRRDAEETTRGEVLLVFHRLAGYAAGPVTSEVPTALLEDVERVYREFAAGDEPYAREVAVLVSLLNAAGVGVAPEYVHALADERVDHETIERRLDALSGSVVFPPSAETEDPLAPLETIHEAWSEQFLRHLLAEESRRRASGVVGDCLTALLSLADDPDRRESVAWFFEGERDRLRTVAEDPSAWVAETLRSVYALARRTPGLAPLFGTAEHSRIDLPECTPPATRLECIGWRGEAYMDAGDFERAAAEFETLIEWAETADVPDDRRREFRADAHRHRGRLAMEVQEYDDAERYLATALELYERLEDDVGVADTLRARASVERFRGNHETAATLIERSIEAYRAAGDERSVADCRQLRGLIAVDRGEYDRARTELEAALSSYDEEESGGRRRTAKCHTNLGVVERNVGNLAAAASHDRQARELYREQGDRHGLADATHNLGETCRRQGDLDAATTALEEALENYRAIDDDDGVATSLNNLGLVAQSRGDLETAAERFSAALSRDGATEQHAVHALLNLGTLRRETGDLAAAREHLEEGVERARAVDDRRAVGYARIELGRVDLAAGDPGAAADQIAEGTAECERIGATPHAVEGYRWLVAAHERAGAEGAALEACREGVECAASLGDAAGEAAEWLRERRETLEGGTTDAATD